MNKKYQSPGLKHGGEGAVKAIQRGEPMQGIAAEEEQNVMIELETIGRAAIERQTAIRVQTAANLYWQAIQKAAQDGDLDKLDKYVARFGWLAGVAMRSWDQVGKSEKIENKKDVYDLLGGNNDKNED